MIRKIEIGSNNPLLRQKAQAVKEITPEIKELVFDMTETLKACQGLGLAAPQIGQALRIIIVQPSPQERPLVLINPQIKKTSPDKEIMEEACLSLPGFSQLIERPRKIVLKALDINGQTVKIKAQGLLARIIQHEIDHLEGILIVDKSYDQS